MGTFGKLYLIQFKPPYWSKERKKRSNMRKITGQVQHLIENYYNGVIDKAHVLESFKGWNAYALHANAYKFRGVLLKRINKYLKRVNKI